MPQPLRRGDTLRGDGSRVGARKCLGSVLERQQGGGGGRRRGLRGEEGGCCRLRGCARLQSLRRVVLDAYLLLAALAEPLDQPRSVPEPDPVNSEQQTLREASQGGPFPRDDEAPRLRRQGRRDTVRRERASHAWHTRDAHARWARARLVGGRAERRLWRRADMNEAAAASLAARAGGEEVARLARQLARAIANLPESLAPRARRAAEQPPTAGRNLDPRSQAPEAAGVEGSPARVAL
mmetsp:Transcript_22541/g.72090  ORF Transcript_22541/g.72090 Transcript_22541/m.72090 type:complete len:238 (+) Transcript_22541:295-1008(+)